MSPLTSPGQDDRSGREEAARTLHLDDLHLSLYLPNLEPRSEVRPGRWASPTSHPCHPNPYPCNTSTHYPRAPEDFLTSGSKKEWYSCSFKRSESHMYPLQQISIDPAIYRSLHLFFCFIFFPLLLQLRYNNQAPTTRTHTPMPPPKSRPMERR